MINIFYLLLDSPLMGLNVNKTVLSESWKSIFLLINYENNKNKQLTSFFNNNVHIGEYDRCLEFLCNCIGADGSPLTLFS